MAERLWAPWRMDYILGPKGAPCVFCAIAGERVDGLRAALVLVAQPQAFVCLNRYPFNAGHLLVAPRQHLADLNELPGDAYAAFMQLMRDSVACLKDAVEPDGVNVGFNLGKAGGAGIAEHLHVHVVPRWVGDQNFMPVIADTRVMPEHLDATWARLRPAFEPLPGLKAPLGPR
jgi:ATP adenylyltransferase